jgi:hypothetical protein
MLTETQRAIFTKILDTNWELKELKEEGKWNDALEKSREHNSHVQELKTLMGEKEYNHFIEMGQRMFAPKTN